jgi:hypothetical protein
MSLAWISVMAGSMLIIGGGWAVDEHLATSKESPQPVAEIASPYNGCGDCTLQARQIAWSLDNQPDQWSADEFIANRRGTYIWVANSDYGITVSNKDRVSPQGFGWKPETNDRSLIWRSFAAWKNRASLHAEDIKP